MKREHDGENENENGRERERGIARKDESMDAEENGAQLGEDLYIAII